MNSKKTMCMSGLVIAASVCASTLLAGANQATPSATSLAMPKVEQEVREAVAQFYVALNVLFIGEMKPMNDVWSHADDVTYMGPAGGFQVGWNDVGDELSKQAAMKLGCKIEPSEIHVTAVGDALAVVSNYEKGENVDSTGKKFSVSIRATTMFRSEGGKWKMIGHHTDLLPGMGR